MLRDKLNEALKDSMRARDMAAVGTIRLILAKLKEVDIASRTEANREGVADKSQGGQQRQERNLAPIGCLRRVGGHAESPAQERSVRRDEEPPGAR